MATVKGTDPPRDNRLKAPCNEGDSGVDACKAGFPFLLRETGLAVSRRGACFSVFLDQPSRTSHQQAELLPASPPSYGIF